MKPSSLKILTKTSTNPLYSLVETVWPWKDFREDWEDIDGFAVVKWEWFKWRVECEAVPAIHPTGDKGDMGVGLTRIGFIEDLTELKVLVVDGLDEWLVEVGGELEGGGDDITFWVCNLVFAKSNGFVRKPAIAAATAAEESNVGISRIFFFFFEKKFLELIWKKKRKEKKKKKKKRKYKYK